MIRLRDYQDEFREIAEKYSMSGMEFTSSLKAWSEQYHLDLNEPAQFMKVIAQDGHLGMMIQEEVSEDTLHSLINGLSIRWMVHNNLSSPESRLNTDKKKLAYIFLKEFARTIPDFQEDEMKEDDWAISEMEKMSYFNE